MSAATHAATATNIATGTGTIAASASTCTAAAKPVIFMTGATGYIGGTFLHLMLERNYLSRFTISALVRRLDDVNKMKQLGVSPVLGSLGDYQTLKMESSRASIVFNTANCDHDTSIRAIIDGLEQRAHATPNNPPPILIHTSGAGVLSTNSKGTGLAPSEDALATIWDDADVAAHTAIPSHAPHRFVDVELFAAAKTGLIRTYLVVPPTVFGRGLGFGAQRMSIQIPRLVYHALQRGRAQYVGDGDNQWTNVHVVDLAELYLLILEGAIKGTAPHGAAGIYYPATEYFTWSTVAHEVGRVLHAKGLVNNPIATTGLQRGWFWGSNVRMISTNGKQLGWAPKHGGTKEMLESVEWDVKLTLDAGGEHQ